MIVPRRFLITIVVVAAAAACAVERGDMAMQESAGYADTKVASAVAPAAPDADAARAEQAPAQALPDSVRPTMLIRNGAASVEVESLDSAITAVRALAARVSGYVTNVAMQSGEERIREATLTIRLPADRFDEALDALDPIGEIEAVNVTTEDVGEEYVDVQMRLANARRLEERLIELLGTRTGQLDEVLAVERELARVREQIERQEGRLRYLRSRVALSTLAVTVHEPGPLLANSPGQNVIVRSLRQSLRNFVGLIAAVIASLGVVLPLAGLGWVGWLLFRRARRAHRERRRLQPVEPQAS